MKKVSQSGGCQGLGKEGRGRASCYMLRSCSFVRDSEEVLAISYPTVWIYLSIQNYTLKMARKVNFRLRGVFVTTIKNKIIKKKVIQFLKELDFICVAMRTDRLWGFERENWDKQNNYRVSDLQISASEGAAKNNRKHICFDNFFKIHRHHILT